MKRIVLIPAYCPDNRLIEQIAVLKDRGMTCVIVNDGSPEEYNAIFASAAERATVLSFAENRGKGAALKHGMEYIRDREGECVVICADADGQHLPADIEKCAVKAEEEGNAFVLGTRKFKKEDMPARSWYGNRISEAVFALLTGLHVKDTQTGLRAFPSGMIPLLLEAEGERYEYEMNQLLLLAKKKIPVCQTDIEAVYENNNACSHFRPLRDSLLIFRQIAVFALSSFGAFLLDTSLFWVFAKWFAGRYAILEANVLARLISAVFNYECNRKVVFADSASRSRSALRYACLAALILLANSTILWILTSFLRIPSLPAKLLTEGCLFVFSWIMQKNVVFSGSEERKAVSS